MFKRLKGLFSSDIAIDLGTANTLIYSKESKKEFGIELNEPSVVAVKRATENSKEEVVAVGFEAKNMIGRTPTGIRTIRPLRDGVIANFSFTEKMLQYFIRKVHNRKTFFSPSPRVLVCVPAESTPVERNAIRESALGAGAREVYLIEEPMAAAIGAGLPVNKPLGSMVVDIGGGTTEAAVISLDGIVLAKSERAGGDHIDEAILSYVKQNFSMTIGEPTAEDLKHRAASALQVSDEENKTVEVFGFDNRDDLPRPLNITINDINKAIQEPLSRIISAIQHVLQNIPPELSADVYRHGIVLTGGGALLKNLDKLVTQRTGIACFVAENPLTCVARGGGIALERIVASGRDLYNYDDHNY